MAYLRKRYVPGWDISQKVDRRIWRNVGGQLGLHVDCQPKAVLSNGVNNPAVVQNLSKIILILRNYYVERYFFIRLITTRSLIMTYYWYVLF